MTSYTTQAQGTLDWQRTRLGKITGSCVGNIIGRGRGADFSTTGLTYLKGVAAERMLNPAVVEDDVLFEAYLDETGTNTKAMRIGHEREAEARGLYATLTGFEVQETGSVSHPSIPGFASSPDGLVGLIGCLEIKCPKVATAFGYVSEVHSAADLRKYNPVYYWQCVAHMWVTGRRWCDFTVYCPYLTKPLHTVRINADPAELTVLEDRVRMGLAYIDRLLDTDSSKQPDQS